MYAVPNSVTVEISGDLAGVASLPKQINFAASRTMNDLLDRAPKDIDRGLRSGLIIRTDWDAPGRRFGIKTKFAKPTNLEGQVGTAADWLLEEEGFHGGVKQATGLANRAGYVPKGLAIPDVGNARPSLRAVMPPSQKAGKLIANAQRSKAFIVTTKNGTRLVLQRVGQDSAGNLLRNSRGNFRIGRKSERTGGTKTVVKAVLRASVRVPQKHIFVDTAVNTMKIENYATSFAKNLINALRTAKNP